MSEPEYWNHNVAYHPVVLDAVPARCETALDVGCGDGLLVRKLAAGPARHVTGIDRSPQMIATARGMAAGATNVAFVEGDFLTHDLPEGGYDFVCAVATVHHMDFTAALTRMSRLLCPGGALAVVGMARNATPLDWAFGALGIPAARIGRLAHGEGGPDGLPVKDPSMSWREVRAGARSLLSGARFRRHLLWRYSLTWTKP